MDNKTELKPRRKRIAYKRARNYRYTFENLEQCQRFKQELWALKDVISPNKIKNNDEDGYGGSTYHLELHELDRVQYAVVHHLKLQRQVAFECEELVAKPKYS